MPSNAAAMGHAAAGNDHLRAFGSIDLRRFAHRLGELELRKIEDIIPTFYLSSHPIFEVLGPGSVYISHLDSQRRVEEDRNSLDLPLLHQVIDLQEHALGPL